MSLSKPPTVERYLYTIGRFWGGRWAKTQCRSLLHPFREQAGPSCTSVGLHLKALEAARRRRVSKKEASRGSSRRLAVAAAELERASSCPRSAVSARTFLYLASHRANAIFPSDSLVPRLPIEIARSSILLKTDVPFAQSLLFLHRPSRLHLCIATSAGDRSPLGLAQLRDPGRSTEVAQIASPIPVFVLSSPAIVTEDPRSVCIASQHGELSQSRCLGFNGSVDRA